MSGQEHGPIVVAVPDRDVYSALRYGSWEALVHDAGLELVHVLRPDEDLATAEATVVQAAQLAGTMAGPGVPVTQRVVVGDPVAGAMEAVADARLVVIRDRDVLHLLRTIAEREPDEPIPAIACVPTGWDLEPDDRRPVLVGVDDPDRCRSLVARALDIARVHETRLQILHAWHFPPPYDELIDDRVGPHWRRETQARIEAVVAHCVAQSGDHPGHHGVPVDVRVEHGVPATLLVEAARSAQLLVLERNSPILGVGARLGRTARAAIHNCPCPVLLLPPGHARSPRPDAYAEAGATGSATSG